MPRRRIGILALVPITAIAVALSAAIAVGQPHADAHGATATRAAFHDAMRKLWEDHITWTRLVIVSAATNDEALPDLGPTLDRLLANQSDIGNAIKPFYGDAAGEQLGALLEDHINIAVELVLAIKAGDDSAAIQDASDRWYANANDIAQFLHEANPRNWSLEDMQSMMKMHLDLTAEEAVDRIGGHFADDVVAYDKVHDEILEMADMLSAGIIAQFPAKFAH
jgi:hypothetical protein